MAEDRISFIGGGNMASSLIGGLVADGFPAERIRVSEPDARRRAALHERFGVGTARDNVDAVEGAATLLLAVKPQVMAGVVRELAGAVGRHRPLVVSIAAGVRETDLRRWLGGEPAIVRAMPNTPALVRRGATALFANPHVSGAQRERAQQVLCAVGLTVWVEDEALMDAVTALSGSGPAYAFLLLEVMERAAVELGLPGDTARRLALQTVYGAASMALESEDDPATLRARVTSPGGTTEAAIGSLEQSGVAEAFARALRAARDRSVELGRALGDA